MVPHSPAFTTTCNPDGRNQKTTMRSNPPPWWPFIALVFSRSMERNLPNVCNGSNRTWQHRLALLPWCIMKCWCYMSCYIRNNLDSSPTTCLSIAWRTKIFNERQQQQQQFDQETPTTGLWYSILSFLGLSMYFSYGLLIAKSRCAMAGACYMLHSVFRVRLVLLSQVQLDRTRGLGVLFGMVLDMEKISNETGQRNRYIYCHRQSFEDSELVNGKRF